MNSKLQETLIITQEECAEVIQEISKIFRFGIENLHKSGITHNQKLTQEIGDLLCMIDILKDQGIILQEELEIAKQNKINKLKVWSKIYES